MDPEEIRDEINRLLAELDRAPHARNALVRELGLHVWLFYGVCRYQQERRRRSERPPA